MKALNDVVSQYNLPPHALLLGVAKDGPVLFNPHTSASPNIMIWDRTPKQGLRILKVVADYILHFHSGHRIEFLVLTRFPEDWGELNEYGMGTSGATSCIGIIPFSSSVASKVVSALRSWMTDRNIAKNPIIILIDGLENVNKMGRTFQDDFMSILFEGRDKNIYTIGTSKGKYADEIKAWLRGFQHYILGSDVENVFEMLEHKGTAEEYMLRFSTPDVEDK